MNTALSPGRCPKCGAPVPAEAPQGLCPKCVLAGAAGPTEIAQPQENTSDVPSNERVAAAFPQLEIIELLGHGGMGAVYKARQPKLDRTVALKLLHDSLAKNPAFAERFNREARVLARLNHPNIVSVYDFGEAGGFFYLLMEYVDGVNMRQAMQAGRFSPAEALGIVPKICEALQYAHSEGILHRDIKPENILIDARGRVKIADFGIAKLLGDGAKEARLTASGAAVGTPHYMAPEQLERPQEVDHRADIYSLGVVFYEMLTGELPIGRFSPPSQKAAVDARVDEVVFRTLEKEREKRFQSAGEVKTEVEHLVRPLGAAPAGPPGLDEAQDFILCPPVKRPAQALLASGILNWVGSIAMMFLLLYVRAPVISPLETGPMAAIGLLMLLFSGTIIWGALKMMKLEAWSLAVSGSVLAMITTPGNIVGLPVGIWALVTLLRPEVRAAFRQRKPSPKEHPGAGTPESRVSQKAVWGTALTALSYCVIVPILVWLVTYNAVQGGGGIALGWLEIVTSFGISFVPGVAGTILGAMAIGDLRRQPDRLHGQGLALFAALGWPLLAFNLVLLFLGRNFDQLVRNVVGILPFFTAPVFFLTLILVLVCINWWVTSAAWRRMNGLPGPGHSLAPEQKLRFRLAVGLITAAMMVLPLLILAMSWLAHSPSRPSGIRVIETGRPSAIPTFALTVTAVELREDVQDGSHWLAIDFAEDTDCDCELFVRTARGNPDEIPVTRKTYYLKEMPGRTPVKHQRVEWQLPSELNHDARLALRETVATHCLYQTITLRPGDERLVLNVPLKKGGTLAGYLGAKFKGKAP